MTTNIWRFKKNLINKPKQTKKIENDGIIIIIETLLNLSDFL